MNGVAALKALLFDQDGVIVDTERDGHRVAFNETFAEFGFPTVWDETCYHELLQVGGGKERMRHHWMTKGFGVPIPPDQIDEVIHKLHLRKTERFVGLIERGALPLRPGVHRLMREAQAAGVVLGVCTTSNERSARAITGCLLPDISFGVILAGDVVPRKKPDPAIYLLAAERLGLAPEDCLVVEDSNIGARAACGAGCAVLATVNAYTRHEDLGMADVVVSDLGEPGVPSEMIRAGRGGDFPGWVTMGWLQKTFCRP
jgi:HAD superfamily hydrolase (TIGR01509 family)